MRRRCVTLRVTLVVGRLPKLTAFFATLHATSGVHGEA